MKVLVTGGAGYVGSTVALALLDAGVQPVVLDDLSAGRAEFLRWFPHYVGDVADRDVLDSVFAEHPDIEIAIHCAARTVVSESLADPLTYYRENVAKTVQFVEALLALGCPRLIFSSSAAVYGSAPTRVVTEDAAVSPASPYAMSKVMVERVLADACAATPLRALSLRYFNPIGCDPQLRTGPYDPTPTHALGSLLAAWTAGEPFRIHGADWDTPDGTPLRDFVHVWDVARAHVAAALRWRGDGHLVVNVGSGRGTTVRELADAFNQQVERPVPIEYDGRRAGDTVGCYASIARAEDVLGWRPERSVDDAMVDVLGWAKSEEAR